MIVQINPEWRINATDDLNWVVQRFYPASDKRKKDAWENQAYFGRLDGAIAFLARRRIAIMEGTYGPEALAPIIEMTDRIERETKAALESYTAG